MNIELNVSRMKVIIISVTMKDVARKAGLSIATISKYINGGNVLKENRVIIDKAIKELGFEVNEIARGLKTNKTMTVGLLIPSLENIFFTSILSNIESILIDKGYSTIICDYKEDKSLEKQKLDFLVKKMVDGIVTMPMGCDLEIINSVIGRNIPVVLIDRALKGVDCDAVLVDNLNASYNAVEQLIILGHKRIGIICGPDDIYTAQERLRGYERVHEDYAMTVDHKLVKKGDYQIESGYRLLLELIKMKEPPTAVLVTNYEMTLGAIMAINESDIKIPDDISFIGFDNLQLAKVVKPPLSIVIQPVKQIGEVAANMLLKRLRGDGSSFPSMVRLKTELILKDSVRKIGD
ncbi:LacI family transcriptional regulator [Anaerobacterium chartisolvens]|uniref:LacI family transcriptional regulator n=1 Tax=Anaerobacterium chartisolvens TaxID=1297424 RepID=A0A369B0G4_9FIRM|nr:LacI family DNA-binding transcriptional regulator [Anaerobacterium chartisolvens]RCX14825.1 LacI family transcriptional regulator [Anaerobacterium chartisolvens]